MRKLIRRLLALILVAGIASLAASSCALGKDPRTDGTSSSEARSHAITQVPFQRLNEQARQKLKPVLEDPSLFRHMPTQTIQCDPEMFNFLVRHPEVLVNVWDLMGVTKVNIKRLTPFVFKGEDGAGTACQAELIYGDDDLHIYYGHGTYDGSMIGRELKGRCVCVLHGRELKQHSPDGPLIQGDMDVFIKIDNIGVDLVARTIAPLVGKTADYNFIESAKFVSQISQVAQRNPVAIQQLAGRMTKIQPAVRDEFVQVAANVAKRNAIVVTNAHSGQEIPRGMMTSQGFANGEESAEIALRAFKQNTVPPVGSTVTPEKREVIMRR